MLFHVYKEEVPEGHYLNEPTGIYKTLLDADWLMYTLLPLLFLILIVVLIYAWHLHEIPKHKAEKKKMRQAELVSALTLLGLFEHWVWPIALIIAYVDWDAMEETLTRILRNSRTMIPDAAAEPAVAAAIVVAVPPPVDALGTEAAKAPQDKAAGGPAE